uniref:Nucleoporin 42 n=1 Tax=Zosterops lateralis melanops TaxID=1220523 RepID=A0A8D2PQA8_ZOSLA
VAMEANLNLRFTSGRGGGGWGTSNQRYSNVIQPSSFKSDTWGGSRDHGRGFFGSSDFGSSGGSSRNFLVRLSNFIFICDFVLFVSECVVKDMEIWESSGQWIFSCYSPMKEKLNVSGSKNMLLFTPFQIDAVQELALQWKNRLLQLKALNASTKAALVSVHKWQQNQQWFSIPGVPILTVFVNSLPAAFPVSSSSTSASSFSFKTTSSLVSSTSSGSSPAAGSSSAAANPPAFGTMSSPSSPQSVGFGSPAAPSAASFSFKTAATAGGFGTSGFSGFGSAAAVNSASTTPLPAFGAFSATTASSGSPLSGALFGQSASASGHAGTSASAAATNSSPASEKLFTPKSELSAEEWQQFEAKEFTIGKIPLKPPPLELLNAFDLLSLFRSNIL